MTDLMETLYDYLVETHVTDLLAVDPEYRMNNTKVDAWSMDLPDHLDEAGKTLFDQYERAWDDKSDSEKRATYQAALALCRELNDLLRP